MDAPSNSVRSMPGRHPKASPHGPFEELFEGIWFVRGGIRFPMLMPMKIGRSMTVVQGVDGLTLFNTMRLSEPGLRRLESLGAVKHVIRLGGFHGRDDGFYRERYGFLKAYNVGPGWLQFASPSRQDVRAILNLEFDHVLPGHGTPVIGGAKEKYRPAIEGPLAGCHE